jgi:RNA polymerase sigma-70 factor (ECF subfamily)
MDTTATLGRSSASSLDADDRVLARALVAGDAEAFRILVERETTRVFRTCYRILGRIDEAEDATQETFVLAYRGLHTFRGDGSAGAWVARIASRESWRRAAQRARRRRLTTSLDGAAMETPTAARGPLDETLHAEEREAVRLAVADLSDPYREIVTLRFFGELSIVEIAAVLGRPEGTVKAQLHRGLKRLRAPLAGRIA